MNIQPQHFNCRPNREEHPMLKYSEPVRTNRMIEDRVLKQFTPEFVQKYYPMNPTFANIVMAYMHGAEHTQIIEQLIENQENLIKQLNDLLNPKLSKDEEFAIGYYKINKLEAIKYLMKVKGTGLKETKEFIEKYQ